MADVVDKDALKQEITVGFSAPDVKDRVVRFTDVKAAFLKAARKEFGWVVEKVISHEMAGMEKKGTLPAVFPGSKFGEGLIQAVDDGQVPAVGYNVMKTKITPMIVEAIRNAPEQIDAPAETPVAAAPAVPASAASAPKPKN